MRLEIELIQNRDIYGDIAWSSNIIATIKTL